MNRRFQFAVILTSACIVALLMLGTVKVPGASPDDPYTQLRVYSDVLTKIQREYVEDPDLAQVTVGAISGLLESIDPFASYLDKEQFEQYQKENDPSRPNVGLILSRGPGYLRVVDTVPGSPAERAGLATGDLIESIDNISTRDMPLAFGALLLQGDAGSTVGMSVLTPRQSDPQTISMTREAVTYPALTSRLVTDQGDPIALITPRSLAGERVGQVAEAVRRLERQGARHIILDLRYCSDGAPEEGVALADLFMDQGLIAYTVGKRERREDFRASAARSISALPLVVLTNRGTAGAAEVAAAALMDSGRAQVVGEPSYGDAAVREAVKLRDGGAIILSVAKFYSPEGKPIQDDKVVPSVLQAQFDVPVDPDIEAPNGALVPPVRTGRDPILNRGYELINGSAE